MCSSISGCVGDCVCMPQPFEQQASLLMQCDLRAFFRGEKKRAAEQTKRPVGRPRIWVSLPQDFDAEVPIEVRRRVGGEDVSVPSEFEPCTPPVKRKRSIELIVADGTPGAEGGVMGEDVPSACVRRVRSSDSLATTESAGSDMRKMSRSGVFTPAAKLTLCELRDKLRQRQPDASDELILSQLSQATGWEKIRVRNALRKEHVWRKMGQSLSSSEQLGAEAPSPRQSLRRAPGAGRKSGVSFLCPLMKVWFESMRNAGHRTLQADVLREWEFAARLFVEKLEAKVRGVPS